MCVWEGFHTEGRKDLCYLGREIIHQVERLSERVLRFGVRK